jgi:hypothetical protein
MVEHSIPRVVGLLACVVIAWLACDSQLSAPVADLCVINVPQWQLYHLPIPTVSPRSSQGQRGILRTLQS